MTAETFGLRSATESPAQMSADDHVAGSAMTSVDKALAVLEAFRGPGAILGVTEIARRSNLPKSTVHRLLVLLSGRGYIERHGNRYRVGEMLFELGNLVSHCQPRGIRGTAMPYMMDLVRATSATVQLAVPSRAEVLVLEKICSHRVVNVPTHVGSRLSVARSALGQAIFAFRSDDSVEQLPADWPGHRSGGVSKGGELLERSLGRVRETGFAYEVVNSASAVVAIAAPIFDPHGSFAIAALSVAFRKSDVTVPHIQNDLRHAAGAISRSIDPVISELA